jgi:serine/threonine protein kinase
MLINQYRAGDFLGAGGLAKVHQATKSCDGEPCALKLIYPSLTTKDHFISEVTVQKMLSESRTTPKNLPYMRLDPRKTNLPHSRNPAKEKDKVQSHSKCLEFDVEF